MKVKMIALALLLMGMQMFAITRNIPSMKPAEIVKLNYASLPLDEQNSLWFTAMFTGLQSTRGAARQVIKKSYPNVDWQKIEQIALSAKQSNKIDEGIKQAQVTVGITRTPVVPTTPSSIPTTAGVQAAAKPFTPAQVPSGKPSQPLVAGGHRQPAPAVAQPSSQLTEEQKTQLQQYAAELNKLQKEIVELNPKYLGNNYSLDAVMAAVESTSFNDVIADIKQRIEALKGDLSDLLELNVKVSKVALEIKGLLQKMQNIAPNHSVNIYGTNVKNYEDFIKIRERLQPKEGVRVFLQTAYYIRDMIQEEVNRSKKPVAVQELPAPAVAQPNAQFTKEQGEQLEQYVKTLNQLQHKIAVLFPAYQPTDYPSMTKNINGLSFDNAVRLAKIEIKKLENTLYSHQQYEKQLDNTIAEIGDLFKEVERIKPGHEVNFWHGTVKNYDMFKRVIMDDKAKTGVASAYRNAQLIKGFLESTIRDLKAQQNPPQGAQAAPQAPPAKPAVTTTVPQELSKPLLQLAQDLNAKLKDAREYDPLYRKGTDYTVIAEGILARNEPAQYIKDLINDWKSLLRNEVSAIALLKSKRDEYNTLLNKVQNKIKEVKQKAPPIPDFAGILNSKGLNEATKELNEYASMLNKIK